jgi:hypothetical protein
MAPRTIFARLLALLVLVASGPAVADRGFIRLYDGAERPEREVVYLQPGEPVKLTRQQRRELLVPTPEGPWPATKLVSLDGVAIPGDGLGAVEFTPGRHTLVFAVQSIDGGELWEVDKDWVANTIYQSVTVNTARGYEGEVQCGELWAPIESGPDKGKTKLAVMQCGVAHGKRKLEQRPAKLYALEEASDPSGRIYEGPPRPPTEIALLHPSSSFESGVLFSSYHENSGFGVSNKVMSAIPRVYFVAVDGRDAPGAGNGSLEVEAGQHSLEVRLVAPNGTNKLYTFDIDVKGGVAYDIFCLDGGDHWIVGIKKRARWVRD